MHAHSALFNFKVRFVFHLNMKTKLERVSDVDLGAFVHQFCACDVLVGVLLPV